ncbi:preprotein translocase subunit SecA [Candidatus Bipolaricaulota bacterium]|nr:preprotein translocase subunit SecA [Candidatus Bipolaricaulota bacterium]
MANNTFRNVIDRMLGQTNAQQLKHYDRELRAVNALSDQMQALSDDGLRAKATEFRQRLAAGTSRTALRAEVYAVVREVAMRTIGERPYDVQILGGFALDDRKIAEMQTGEGKTLLATMPATLNALSGKVHVVTVNDYLARRDREWMGPVYEALGLSVGLLQDGMSSVERQPEYAADITFGTNNQFGFDYLRDNMVHSSDQKVQGSLDFAIIDEIDNILVDEARTPLIISASAAEALDRYRTFAMLVKRFRRDDDFEMDEETRRLTLTDEGIHRAEKALSIENIFGPEHTETLHHIETALRALHFYKKEQQYIVKDGRVMIVDDFTGRLMPDRRYSDGLHQAIEAKEGLKVQRESQTMAQITLQHYFQLYKGLSGMTGTAKTEEDEFKQIYALPVLVIPTNKPLKREAMPDRIFRTHKAKFEAIVDEVDVMHQVGRPVLIGTNSIETSEQLSNMLKRRGLEHHVLNAKHHEREAEIVAQAGQHSTITVATNMAGRGTDIKLGEGVAELGGLHVIGCQRHDSRRIDNQLLGRAGRQGDPGSSQFYLSMEDDLLRIFGGDRMSSLMDRIGLKEGEAIEHNLLNGAIRRAQQRVEGRNFEIRKRLLEFDLVLARQRDAIYSVRDRFLLPPRDQIDALGAQLEADLDEYMDQLYDEISSNLVSAYAVSSAPQDEWNLHGLAQELSFYGTLGESALVGHTSNKLIEIARTHLETALANQKARLGKPYPLLARYIILHTIDEAWRTHLYTLDDLKGGIGWTAYGGTDPLVAFKRESFILFKDMLTRTAEKTCKSLLNPRLTISGGESAPTPQEHKLQYVHPSNAMPANVSSTAPSTPGKTPSRSTVKEPGRNDPCPCGSGQKYKKCCGAS